MVRTFSAMSTEPDARLHTEVYTDPDPQADQGVSRAHTAYSWIKRQLLTGEFALSGRLGEERVAAELGISRTPVREAISRLHAEGLVERHPDGGYTPSIPDLEEIVELYEVRSILENASIIRPDHDVALLTALRDDWRSIGDDEQSASADPEFVLLDEDFHVRLAQSGGNRALATTLQSINERIRIVRMHDFLTSNRIGATVTQHLAIVEALIDGDTTRAQRALNEHLTESADVVHQRAATAIARMLTKRRDSR